MADTVVTIVEEFVIASGKRKISLQKHPQLKKPWQIYVYIKTSAPCEEEVWGEPRWTLLSTAEYFDEEVARKDFEIRRPKMRDAAGEHAPMQQGKRLIQEVMNEKLGPRDADD